MFLLSYFITQIVSQSLNICFYIFIYCIYMYVIYIGYMYFKTL